MALDVETSARIGGLAEYRLQNGRDDYLKVTGAFFDESIRSQQSRISEVVDNQIADPHIPVDRYGLIGLMREHLTPDLVAYGDAVTVSDSLYLREMNTYTLSRGYGSNFGVLRTADSHFGLIDGFEDSFVRLQGTWIQDLIQPQDLTLQTLPELLWSGRQQLAGGLAYSDFDLQAINYWRADGVSGQRVDLNPRLDLPWRWGDYLYGLFNLGARETFYDVSGHDIGVIPAGTAGHANNNGLFLDGSRRAAFTPVKCFMERPACRAFWKRSTTCTGARWKGSSIRSSRSWTTITCPWLIRVSCRCSTASTESNRAVFSPTGSFRASSRSSAAVRPNPTLPRPRTTRRNNSPRWARSKPTVTAARSGN